MVSNDCCPGFDCHSGSMVVIREEEDEDDKKAAAKKSSSSKSESGAGVRIQDEGAKEEEEESVRESSGRAEIGQDAEDEGWETEGWETASEGGEEFEEASGEEDENEPGGIGKNLKGDLHGQSEQKPEASTSDQVDELENKLRQVDVEGLRKQALDAASAAKAEGNALYGQGQYVEALQAYERGLGASQLKESDEDQEIKEIRAILHCNRAACYIGLDNNDAAGAECTKALELNPQYVKALVRRAQVREKLTLYEEAMADWNKVLEIDPTMTRAKTSLRQLAPLAEEKREKLKEEMISKLKEAGNSILGRFGMSIDNFKTVQDPNTGSYSIQFQR